MKIPNYQEAHLKKAEEYKVKIENGGGDYDDNHDLYLFHLEQAEAWDILIKNKLKSIEGMKTRLSKDQFYSNFFSLRLISSLINYYEKNGDEKNAKKTALELDRKSVV